MTRHKTLFRSHHHHHHNHKGILFTSPYRSFLLVLVLLLILVEPATALSRTSLVRRHLTVGRINHHRRLPGPPNTNIPNVKEHVLHQRQHNRQFGQNHHHILSPYHRHAYPKTTKTTTTTSLPLFSSAMLEGMGMPSNPGWKSGRLNRLTKWADNRQPNRPAICEYEPSGWWLWKKWRGTCLKTTWPAMVVTMMTGLLLDLAVRHYSSGSWSWYAVPSSENNAFLQVLSGLRKAWEYHLTLTTFILTFFLGQSLAYWQKVYNTTRMIQGRINDYCMLLAMGTEREMTAAPPGTSDNNEDTTAVNGVNNPQVNGDVVTQGLFVNNMISKQSTNSNGKESNNHDDDATESSTTNTYTSKSRQLVQTCTRLIRMSHIFFWAVTPTASNGLTDSERYILDAANCPLPVGEDEGIGPVLLSKEGLKALVNTGQLTKDETAALEATGLPPSQYAYVLLVWAGLHTMEGLRKGYIKGGVGGLETNLLDQLSRLRASMFDIDDFRAGRMPLAYVQLVQVLVDSLALVTPFVLYPELGSLSIILVGLLTLFFRGLLTLSKSFLDPFGVEGFQEQNIRVDVLVSELNFGAAKRWIQAGNVLPLNRKKTFSNSNTPKASASAQ